MRFPYIIIAFICGMLALNAEDYRKWTEAETKRQIAAKIVDKKLDDSEAKLTMKNGKSMWIKAERLIPEDRDYIKTWMKPVDHIAARVVASGNKRKTVEVTAVAGGRPLTVKAYWRETASQPIGYPKVYKLAKGEEKIFIYNASSKYVVRAWSEGELVDEEGWNTKKGL